MAAASSNEVDLRAELLEVHFDSNLFVENQLSDVDMESMGADKAEIERKLFLIFDGLTRELAMEARKLEDKVELLQETAKKSNESLLKDMNVHSNKLSHVKDSVNSIKSSFDDMSEGIIKIGDRLSQTEDQRRRIEHAMELITYINHYKDIDNDAFLESIQQIAPNSNACVYTGNSLLDSTSLNDIKTNLLPEELYNRDWGHICEVLSDLRRVLSDIQSDEACMALANVLRLSEKVESELLSAFIKDLSHLMEFPEDEDMKHLCKQTVRYLHLFNNGQTLHKRYIYAVIEKRMPQSIFGYDGGILSSPVTSPGRNAARGEAGGVPIVNRRQSLSQRRRDSLIQNVGRGSLDLSIADGGNSYRDSMHSIGSSPHNPGSPLTLMSSDHSTSNDAEEQANKGYDENKDAIDYLSELFLTIGNVCREQSVIIQQVFPRQSMNKVMRSLIQRIYNDPAFGIQSRVDAVMHPKPPLPPLQESDYLESLSIVKEKLSALYLMLSELCTKHSYFMTSLSTIEDEKRPDQNRVDVAESNGSMGKHSAKEELIDDEDNGNSMEREKLQQELREFLEEQSTTVLTIYMNDYFEKEISHTRGQYADALKQLIIAYLGANTAYYMTSTTSSVTPRIKMEKMKSIVEITDTVANTYFISSILGMTTDTVCRMMIVGRDERRLANRIKDVFMLQLDFISEGILTPSIQACITLLIHNVGEMRSSTLSRYRGKSSKLPPMEFLTVLTAIYSGFREIRSNFEEVYIEPMHKNGNMVVICREALKNSLKPLDVLAKQAIQAWNRCICAHISRTLSSLQTKADYGKTFSLGSSQLLPSFVRSSDEHNNESPSNNSNACSTVCTDLTQVVNTINHLRAEFPGLDLSEHFWRPLGQQLIGILIHHIRTLSITEEGSAVLNKDLEAYSSILGKFDCKDLNDMMVCLKEICLGIYSAPPERVRKKVVEELRHLDTDVVLVLLRARRDYSLASLQKGKDHWSRTIASAYGFRRWDHELPWITPTNRDKRLSRIRNTSAGSANEVSNDDSKNDQIEGLENKGPTTLRKSSQPLSSLYLRLMQRSDRIGGDDLSERGSDADSGVPSSGGPSAGKDDASSDVTESTDMDIKGPVSFARAVTQRFANYTKLSSFLPDRPTDVTSQGNDNDTIKGGNSDRVDRNSGRSSTDVTSPQSTLDSMRNFFSLSPKGGQQQGGPVEAVPEKKKGLFSSMFGGSS